MIIIFANAYPNARVITQSFHLRENARIHRSPAQLAKLWKWKMVLPATSRGVSRQLHRKTCDWCILLDAPRDEFGIMTHLCANRNVHFPI